MSEDNNDAQEEQLKREREKVREMAPKVLKCKSKKGFKLLKAAANGKDKKVVLMLTKKGIDIDVRDTDRNETALHYAAASGFLSTVDYLLLKGAQVNVRNSKGHTPVHKSCYYDYPDIIRTLVSYGGDVNIRDNDGISPLYLALMRNHQSSFVALIECGASW